MPCKDSDLSSAIMHAGISGPYAVKLKCVPHSFQWRRGLPCSLWLQPCSYHLLYHQYWSDGTSALYIPLHATAFWYLSDHYLTITTQNSSLKYPVDTIAQFWRTTHILAHFRGKILKGKSPNNPNNSGRELTERHQSHQCPLLKNAKHSTKTPPQTTNQTEVSGSCSEQQILMIHQWAAQLLFDATLATAGVSRIQIDYTPHILNIILPPEASRHFSSPINNSRTSLL